MFLRWLLNGIAFRPNQGVLMKDHYIAEKNFPIKIDENVYMLGNYFFNLFLIQGIQETALFEVGISATVDAVIQQLEQLNAQPDFIVCSHPHADHITGLPGLCERFPNARIIVAQGAREFLNHPKAGPMILNEDAFMSKGLGNFGIQAGRPHLNQIPNLDHAFIVENKHRIDLGGVILDLEKVDGHSPGNLMGKIADRQILFCSDSLGFHFPGRGFLPLYFTHAQPYLAVLESIQRFQPTLVCPAHQGPLKGDNAIAGISESIHATKDLIQHICRSKESDETLSEKIFHAYYKDEFTLYTRENIKNCTMLLVQRAKQVCDNA